MPPNTEAEKLQTALVATAFEELVGRNINREIRREVESCLGYSSYARREEQVLEVAFVDNTESKIYLVCHSFVALYSFFMALTAQFRTFPNLCLLRMLG